MLFIKKKQKKTSNTFSVFSKKNGIIFLKVLSIKFLYEKYFNNIHVT